ncbi:propionate CoA-transferase [Mesorhizobium albiziae]|uniref:Propionate CoA-transferase n=1 Tax=Neomesorhizobium albiziae TaxID=335020 RepID=A0A1I3XWN7_9HYPH|nr:CoA-transferase [Mesorhizobium albiziae]GLS30281.1 acyl CoA:acetate/3-ketoacid CoA transferase [Mesorhizobium albiziae]SFK23955.1 propionate CoA-transferase [Mesorhizobium albiziae]
MLSKVVSAEEAVAIIRSGDTVASSGFVGVGTPDGVLKALEQRFLETGEPRNLELVFAAAPGDGKERGLNRLARPGMVARLVGGHFGLVPKLAEMAVSGACEAYNLPLGCVSHLFREIAGRKAGLLSKVGLRTFVDPRNGGGKLNARTTADLVELMNIDGEEWLFYRSFPINVAILRGTTADPDGNITLEKEALTLDNLSLAMAAKNCKGFVIVQVERIAAAKSLNPRHVRIPGALVDCVVVASSEHHAQTYATSYNGAFSGELRAPIDRTPNLVLDERKVIARRCAFELPMGGIVNLGIGVPEGVAAVAAEEKILNLVTLTAEPGIIGGIPQGGLDFGAALNADSIIDQNQMFDFYDGGGLDLACLGLAQVDQSGNVNVSLFGGRLAGAGGFINISQNARRVIFCGTFTAGGLRVAVREGKLEILKEGSQAKFVSWVEHVTFAGDLAAESRQPVLFVTERCVFQLRPEGVELIEVAPGIDIERDIVAHMEFRPMIRDPRLMAPEIFLDKPMDLASLLLNRPMSQRMKFTAESNTLFLGLDGYRVTTTHDIEAVREAVLSLYRNVGKRFSAIINYDAIEIASHLNDAWYGMASDLENQCYDKVSRYTTGAFLRLKMGAALSGRNVAPHIFESESEAVRLCWDRHETCGAQANFEEEKPRGPSFAGDAA